MGYPVTVFEKLGEPGGMAAVGIPDYRLPRTVLGGEGSLVESFGVTMRYGVTLGKDITIDQIRKDFDAVFIGVGAHGSSPMGVEGEDMGYRGFIAGVKYLLDINNGKDPYPEGKKVVVVGGGNVAMDCVRSSFRIGKPDVHLVYRRTKKVMPPVPVELHEAEERALSSYFCATREVTNKTEGWRVECIRMERRVFRAARRPVPVEVPKLHKRTFLTRDRSEVDFPFSDRKKILAHNVEYLPGHQETFETNIPGIFSAGDCETGPDVLVRACGNGKRAAWKIDEYLKGEKPKARMSEKFVKFFGDVKVYDKNENIGFLGDRARLQLRPMAPEVRKWTFDEVEEGFRTDEAITEASRCLRCYRIGCCGG